MDRNDNEENSGQGLEFIDVTKKYGEFCLFLSLNASPGETLVLAGPSGCGKSTALGIAAGLVSPDSGEVRLKGRNITDTPPWKRGVSLVFQDFALFPHLSVAGNIAYPLARLKTPRQERAERVAEILRLLRLSGFENRSVTTLSGGERQRVAIARALAASPAALLLDEPFSGLDQCLREDLYAEFRSLRKTSSAPWLLVTHDMKEAETLGSRVIWLGGRESATQYRPYQAPGVPFP